MAARGTFPAESARCGRQVPNLLCRSLSLGFGPEVHSQGWDMRRVQDIPQCWKESRWCLLLGKNPELGARHERDL